MVREDDLYLKQIIQEFSEKFNIPESDLMFIYNQLVQRGINKAYALYCIKSRLTYSSEVKNYLLKGFHDGA